MSGRAKREIAEFDQAMTQQSIATRHFAGRASIFDHVEFLSLSGYVEAAERLDEEMSRFSVRPRTSILTHGLDTYRAPAAALSHAGPCIVILIYRYNLDDAYRAANQFQHARLNDSVMVRVAYTEGALDRSNEVESPIRIDSADELLASIGNDQAYDDGDFLLTNFADVDAIDDVFHEIMSAASQGAEVVVVRARSHADAPFERRLPERALNFAVSVRQLRRRLGEQSVAHPVLLMAATWSDLRDRPGAVAVVDYYPAPAEGEQRTAAATAHVFDRLTTRAYSDALIRQDAATFNYLVDHIADSHGALELSSDSESTDSMVDVGRLVPRERTPFDVVVATDFRIRGGGVNSILAELEVMQGLGYRVGALQIDATTLKTFSWAFQERASERLSALGIPLLNGVHKIATALTVVRYPPVLNDRPTVWPSIDTQRVTVVINQPPRRLKDAGFFYDPARCHQNGKKLFPVEPEWWPNGPDARAAMVEDAPTIDLADTDWINIINACADDDLVNERIERVAHGPRPLSIGRHSRDAINKWPSSKELLTQAYPAGDQFSIKVLGGAKRAKRVLRRLPASWQVWEYGELAVDAFLRSLDFFVFFPHEDRIEPMARCILEGMSAGMPVILPSRFSGIYGDTPIYCDEGDVLGVLEELTGDPARYRDVCFATRDEAWTRFGPSVLGKRLVGLGVKPSLAPELQLAASDA